MIIRKKYENLLIDTEKAFINVTYIHESRHTFSKLERGYLFCRIKKMFKLTANIHLVEKAEGCSSSPPYLPQFYKF